MTTTGPQKYEYCFVSMRYTYGHIGDEMTKEATGIVEAFGQGGVIMESDHYLKVFNYLGESGWHLSSRFRDDNFIFERPIP